MALPPSAASLLGGHLQASAPGLFFMVPRDPPAASDATAPEGRRDKLPLASPSFPSPVKSHLHSSPRYYRLIFLANSLCLMGLFIFATMCPYIARYNQWRDAFISITINHHCNPRLLSIFSHVAYLKVRTRHGTDGGSVSDVGEGVCLSLLRSKSPRSSSNHRLSAKRQTGASQPLLSTTK
ncbi:hypothetical protein BDP81DRAFT_44080 [Colletotrichum phormii]|uniref:Uncharacterized protein n=1 Tax=Colletotrichum phormii TaxID=359342 RepID=A0AAI9ZQU3_9PEZI|nr:uncharacterized protein BDP81DRAFT_44080 [Colletotrichum phormii]KAK1635012.1 hypothetical protein BDP81DRAFT_44080 [Colletotrichum phormii]